MAENTALKLSETERGYMARLAAGHKITVQAASRTCIGSPETGYVTMRRPAFEKLRGYGMLAEDSKTVYSTTYTLSDEGRSWCENNLKPSEELPLRREPDIAARPAIERLPVCAAPNPYPPAPEVCGGCGNLIDAHPIDAAVQRRAAEAMWKVLIALGAGPHNTWGGGPDGNVAAAFREHMDGCALAWDGSTTTPAIDDVVKTDDTYNNHTVHLLAGYMSCACGKYRNVHVSIRDLTMGQLIWHVARVGDGEPGR